MTAVFERQKGMCSLCGKKFDELGDASDKHFLTTQVQNNGNTDDVLMLCNQCRHSVHNLLSDDGTIKLKKYNFPHAGFLSYNYESMLGDVKSTVEEVLLKAATPTDLKTTRNELRDTLLTVRNLSLEKEHSAELVERLSNTLEDLNKRQDEIYKRNEEEYQNKLELFTGKFDQNMAEIEVLTDFRQSRERLVALQTELNAAKIKRDNYDAFAQRILKAFDDLNTRQAREWERYEMECADNYLKLKETVVHATTFADNAENFNQARKLLIAAQSEFKGLKLKKENREELFSQIQAAFEKLNGRQAVEREGFEKEAEENYATVRPIVDEAIVFSVESPIFKQARQQLIDAQEAIKNVKLRREQRDELYSIIREAFNALNDRQTEEFATHDTECNENNDRLDQKLNEIITDINVTTDFALNRDKLIAVQSEIKLLKLRKEQRQDLFTKTREAFNLFDRKRKEHRDRISKEKLEKLNSIKTNLENKIARLEDSMDWDRRSLDYQKEKLSKMTEEENPETAKEVTEIIDSIEARLTDKEKNIEEIRTRITDIQSELEKL